VVIVVKVGVFNMKILTLIRKIIKYFFPQKRAKFDYSKRYSSNWSLISKRAKMATKYHCCLCHKRTYHLETHHSKYTDWLGFSIAGREKLGVNIFPLCLGCHSLAHRKINYFKDKNNPVFGNRNTKKFTKLLKKRHRKLRKIIAD
jgi:hypothetical protein